MVLYKKGSTGAVVRDIQKALKLYPDGIFGKLTEDRVKEFQRQNGLKQDGIVGPATLALLLPSVVTAKFNLKKSKRKINEIIIHCSATPEGRDLTVAQIKQSHLQRGFSDIGYHYVIYRDGSMHLGRDVDIIGAHCSGHNSYSIGICYVGGLENKPGVPVDKLPIKDTRTEEQKKTMRELLVELKKLYPAAKIIGHRDTSPDKNHNGKIDPFEWIKGCPSFDAIPEYKDI